MNGRRILLLAAALLTGLTPWCGIPASWAADPLAIVYDPTLDVAVKGVLNAPHNYDEALVGTNLSILPASGGDLIDAGTSTAVRGLDNLVGPYLGSAPDVGAYELGLGLPWTGPRHFANLLAYGLPQCWRVAPITELSDYASLGAPSTVEANAFRLLLVTSDPPKPKAFILATFEELQGEARWSRSEELLRPSAGDTVLIPPLYFRDGLGASIVARGNNTHLLGARVDDEGVLKIVAGVAKGSLGAVQEDWFTFVRSLWYAWYRQDTDPKIALNFVTPPTPGFDSVGAPAAPSTGNAVVPGILHGDVTLACASIIWDVEGDVNLNATARVQFRRQGTTQWQDALDLARVYYDDTAYNRGIYSYLAGSVFHLSPGTTYEVKVTLSDPDNGGDVETRTTTFTTNQMPKPYPGGRAIEVWPTDDLDAVTASAQPGDTFFFHAGSYTSKQYDSWWVIENSGTREKPILFRAYGDGEVNFMHIMARGRYTWLDGLTVDIKTPAAESIAIRTDNLSDPSRNDGFTLSRSTVKNAFYNVVAEGHNALVIDNRIIGGVLSKEGIQFLQEVTRGNVAAYNHISHLSDGVSGGRGNTDVHNNKIHDTSDDSLEPDYAHDSYRLWDNLAWLSKYANITFQPIKGGPWYIFRNQFTGGGYNTFKMRNKGQGVIFITNNSIVSPGGDLNADWLYTPGSVFANNYRKVRSSLGGFYDSLTDEHFENFPPDPKAMRLWGYNRYDVNAENAIRGWGTLENAQALGAELNSRLVTDLGTEGLQIYEGTAVPLSSNTGAGSFTWSWSFTVNGGPEQLHSSGTGPIPSVTFDSTGLANRRVEWILRASDGVTPSEARLPIDVWPGSCGPGLTGPALCMDANGDGEANLQDIVTMVQMLVGKVPTPPNFCHLDLNKDGAFNVADVVLGIRHVLNGTIPACNCGGG